MPLDFIKRSWLGRHVGDTRVGGAIIKGVQKRKFEKELSKVKELMENTHDFRHALYAPLVAKVAALATVDPVGAAAQLRDFKDVLRLPETDPSLNVLKGIHERKQNLAEGSLQALQRHNARLNMESDSLGTKLERLEEGLPVEPEALKVLEAEAPGPAQLKAEFELSKVTKLLNNTHDFRRELYAPLVEQVTALAEVDPAGAAAQLKDLEEVLRVPGKEATLNELANRQRMHQEMVTSFLERLQAHKAKLDMASDLLEKKLEALEQRPPFDPGALQALRQEPLDQARLQAEQELVLGRYQGILKSLQNVREVLSLRALKDTSLEGKVVVETFKFMRSELQTLHNKLDLNKKSASVLRDNPLGKLPAVMTTRLLNTIRAHEVSAVLAEDLKSVKPAEVVFASVFGRAREMIKVLEDELKQLEDLTVDPSFDEAARKLDAETELALKEVHRQQQVALQALREQVQESSRLLKHHERPKVSATPAKTLDIPELLAAPPVITRTMSAQQAGLAMQKRMKALMKSSSAQDRADLVLDLLLTDDQQLKETLADQNQWTLEELNAEQEAWLEVCIAAIRKHVKPERETSLNLATKELRIGDQTLGLQRELGSGSNGRVSLFSARDPGSLPSRVAVKRLWLADIPELAEAMKFEFASEIRNHYHLMRGPKDAPGRAYIVELLDVVQDEGGGLNSVMEVAEQGDLESNRLGLNIASQSGILSQTATDLLQARQLEQLVQGMIYIRDQGMTHFDLKPANIFVTADGTLKIGDFGEGGISMAEHGGQFPTESGGTPVIIPSEKGGMDGGDASRDAFALGRIVKLLTAQEHQLEYSVVASTSTGVTGELLRALTDSTGAVRPSLEAVLEAPLLVQARNVDAQKVATLNRLMLDYNRKLEAVLRQEWSSFEAQLQDRMAEVPLFKLPNREASPLEILSFLQEKLTRIGQLLTAYQKGAGEHDAAALAAIRRNIDNSLQDADSIANFEREFLPFSRWVEVEKKRQLLDHPDLKEITAQLKAASDEVTASARTA